MSLILITLTSTLMVSPYEHTIQHKYEGWNFNSGNYLFTTDTK